MPDYQKAKIYKLWSPQGEEDEIYIGSTCNQLYKRKNQHKNNIKNVCRSKILFEKYDDIRIEVIEEYPCNSKAELLKKEGEYITNNKCLNKVIPNRTKKEWYEDNKEKITEYYNINKEHIQKIKKIYNENNKEKMFELKKKYQQNNIHLWENYRKKNNENITCDCGSVVCKLNLSTHQKTPKHIKLMEEIKKN